MMKTTQKPSTPPGDRRISGSPGLIVTEGGEYLSITGTCVVTGPDFYQRVRALYAVAAGLRDTHDPFTLPCLEGLWEDTADGEAAISGPGSLRGYCLMLQMPAFVTGALVRKVAGDLYAQQGPAFVREVELHFRLPERAVQLLHKGSFETEPRSLARIRSFMEVHGFCPDGPRHEIYLRDLQKTLPSGLRTLLRIPVRTIRPAGRRAAGRTRPRSV